HLKQDRRIQVDPLPANRKMQVRSCGPSASAAKPNDLMCLHLIAFFDPELRKVQVKAQQPLPVVDDYAISFKVQRSGQQDRPGVNCAHGCSGGNTEIEALVPAEHFSVEHPRGSEYVGNRCSHWRDKRSLPQFLRRHTSEGLLLYAFVG